MVRIRLRKVGLKNQPSYRIVAADKESPRDGRFLENLGHYNPRTEPSTVQIDEARLFHWLSHGAQPSDSVQKILNPLGTWDRWERFKAGEDLDSLLQEAEASIPEVDPRTRRDDLAAKRPAKKAEKKATAPAEQAKPVEAVPAVEEQAPEEESELPEAVVEETEPEAVVEEERTEEAPDQPAMEEKGDSPEQTVEETPEETEEETSEEEDEEAGKD
jgi:small subunit ribosomal protein S16